MAKPAEVYEKAKNSLRKISIIEVSLTRVLGSLCLANVFNAQSVVMLSYPYIL